MPPREAWCAEIVRELLAERATGGKQDQEREQEQGAKSSAVFGAFAPNALRSFLSL
jgi:hypothetical protein